VADFTLTADGTGGNDLSGTSPVDSGAGLLADTWALSETSPAGYTGSAWSCVGGTQSGANITVGLGGEATCTITNNDVAPKLHLRKVVTNDNGGTATVANFTLTADGTGTNDLTGTSPVDSGAGFQADTFALSESNVYGYSASAWVCVGGSQSGANITVGIGGEATCTITNDDQPGTIIVQKIIKPTGSNTSFSFGTTGSGYNGFSLTGGAQNSQTLNAGNYTVNELVPLGWVLTGIGGSSDPNTPYNCTATGSGGSTGVGDLNTQTATVSLKNGDTVTCVFENTGQGVTRTQGFWATHSQLANIAWFGGTAFGHTFPGVANVAGIGDKLICGRPIDDLGKLMGGFWSDVSKTSSGGKRSALDQARMQLLQQLLAAELNASAFGSVPSSGSFANWEAAYCGTNQNTIKTAQQQAASFNSQGDSSQFTPGTSADSKNARAIATKSFWDLLP
jgi:Prealbumin-like fold domain